MNNKVVLKIVAICAGVLLVFGVLGAVLAIVTIPDRLDDGKGFTFGGGEPFEYHKDEVLELDGITKINIDSVSTDVIFYQSDKNLEVTLDVKGYTRSETITLETEEIGNVLNVKVKYPKFTFGDWGGLNITDSLLQIGIPADYAESLYVSGVSCDIEIQDGISNVFTKLDLGTVSGTAKVSCEQIEYLEFDSTSGDLIVANTLIDMLSVDTTSGDIEVSNINSENGSINVNTVSGSVKIEYSALCKTKINTTSGDIELLVPAGSKMDLDYDSVSGDLSGDYSTSSDGVKLTVDTVSGDLHIENN